MGNKSRLIKCKTQMKDYQSLTFNGLSQVGGKAPLDPMQLTATFEDYEIIEEPAKPRYVLYHIRLHNKLIDYQIKRRFSDFEKLHAALRQQSESLRIPKLPEKFLFNNFESGKLRQRMEKLESYLNELLYDFDFNDPDPTLLDFIELKSNEIMKIGDVNQSNYLFKTKADFFYVQLIYQQEQFSTELEELRGALLATQPSLQTVRLIFNGKDSISSIFKFAFGAKAKDHSKPRGFGAKSQQSTSQLIPFKTSLKTPKKLSFNGKVSPDLLPQFTRREILAAEKPAKETHLRCATITSWILEMLDYSRNPFCHIFRSVFCELNLENFEQTNIKRHLSCPEFTQCKVNIYELLKIYKDVSKSSRQNNECLLFPENEDYRHFCTWYYAQTHPSLRPTGLEPPERSFPKLSELVVRGKVRKELLLKSMNAFAERQNSGLIFYDESNKMTKLCFHIHASHQSSFLECLFKFTWNPNVLTVAQSQAFNGLIFDKDDFARVGVVWIRPDIPHKIFLSLAALHKVEAVNRQLYVFCSTEGSPELLRQVEQELAASDTPLEFKTRSADVQDLDLGLIVDVEKTGPGDRMLVSLVLAYAFLDRRNTQLLWFYEYISRHLKWLLRYVQEKGWLFKGDRVN